MTDPLFSRFNKRQQAAPPPAPAPQPVPPPVQPPAPAPPPAPPPEPGITDFLQKKVAELEKRLFETQEKALSFSLELKNREELQQQNMRQVEEMFNSLRDGRRSEEAEKALRDRLERVEKAASGLEARLGEAGAARKAAEDAARTAEISGARLADRFEAAEERVRALQEKFGSAFEGRFSSLDERLGEVRAGTGSVSEGLGELRSRLGQAEQRSAEMSEFRRAAEARQTGLQDALASVLKRFETMEARLSGLAEGAAASRALPTAVAGLNGRIDEILSALAAAEESRRACEKRVDGLEASAKEEGPLRSFPPKALLEFREGLARIKERLAVLEAGGGSVSEGVKELRSRLGQAERRSEVMTESISTADVRQSGLQDALTGLLKRCETMEERISGLAEGAAAAALSLPETVAGLNGRIDEMLSAMAVSEESRRACEKRVDGLEASAKEALPLPPLPQKDLLELKDGLARMKERLAGVEAEGGSYGDSVKDLGLRLEALEGRLSASAADPAAFMSIAGELSAGAALLGSRMTELEKQAAVAAGSVKSRAESLEFRLENMRVGMESLIAEAIARKSAPREKLEDADARIAALEKSLALIDGLKTEFQALREDNARGSAAAAETRGFAAKLAAFEGALAGLGERLGAQGAGHSSTAADIVSLENKVQYLTVLLNTLRATVGRLSGEPPPPPPPRAGR